MAQTLQKVFYENQLYIVSGSSYYVNSVLTVDPQHRYICDWRSANGFRFDDTNDSYILFPPYGGFTLNTFIVHVGEDTAVGAAFDLTLEVETGLGTGIYTLYKTVTIGTGGIISPGVYFYDITPAAIAVGARVKISCEANTKGTLFKQIYVGDSFEMERGQHQGVAPPTMSGGYVQNSKTSVNGELLDTTVRRKANTTSIGIEHLSQAWVRDSWEPFADHASRLPFYHQWNPTTYPDEIAMAVGSVKTPKNSSPPSKMSVSMPMELIT